MVVSYLFVVASIDSKVLLNTLNGVFWPISQLLFSFKTSDFDLMLSRTLYGKNEIISTFL